MKNSHILCQLKSRFLQLRIQFSYIPKFLWQKIWNLNTMAKIKIFIWSMCHKNLPTRKNLCKRTIAPDPLYPICRQFPHTLEHLPLLCDWTKAVWSDHQLQIWIYNYGISRMNRWVLDTMLLSTSLPSIKLITGIL